MVEEPVLHIENGARNKTSDERANKELQNDCLFPAQSIFFTPITVKSEQKSENRAQDDAVFWIPILRLYYHPQFTSRKGNETEDDRKAFPEVKTCCHHGLFTVSVTTATA